MVYFKHQTLIPFAFMPRLQPHAHLTAGMKGAIAGCIFNFRFHFQLPQPAFVPLFSALSAGGLIAQLFISYL